MTKLSYVVPEKAVNVAAVMSLRETAKAVLEDLIKRTGENPEDYIIRDILPKTDLGLTNEDWSHTFAAANAWETYIDNDLDDKKFVVFMGVALPASSPATLAVKFSDAAKTRAVYHVQSLHALETHIGFFPEPVAYSEKETVKVEVYGNAATTDTIVLLGLVAERKGKTISE